MVRLIKQRELIDILKTYSRRIYHYNEDDVLF